MERKRKFIIMFFLVLITAAANNFAQNNIQAHFDYSDHKIIIQYQFRGDTARDYDVSIALKRKSDPKFNMMPEFLKGDLGKGKYANGERKIIWSLSQQDEKTLTSDDFYFELLANEVKGGGGFMWLIYVALAVAGFFLI